METPGMSISRFIYARAGASERAVTSLKIADWGAVESPNKRSGSVLGVFYRKKPSWKQRMLVFQLWF